MPNFQERASRTESPVPLRFLITGILKIWGASVLGVRWVVVFGGYRILCLIPIKSPRGRKRHRANHADDNGPIITQHSWIITRLLDMPISYPFTFWMPLCSVTLTVFHTFRALENSYTTFDNTAEFATACPEDDRRIQTSALVKLFAATVTTMCIHGHLGTLTGSHSWRHELFRMLEVLVNPLTSLFAAADAAWCEIASSVHFLQGSWNGGLSIGYRLACLCRMRIDTAPRTFTMGSAPAIAAFNPRHIKSELLERDLKWSGRLGFLVVLFAQYVQAVVLLSRRLIANTAATVDCAMLFMTISGLAALMQSLVISIINTKWTLEADSFTPCVARDCSLQPCVTLKTESNLPNNPFNRYVFGYNIINIPRRVLYALAGGNLLLMLLPRKDQTVWTTLSASMATKFYQDILISILVSVYLCGENSRCETNGGLRRNNEDTVSTDSTIPEGTPTTTGPIVSKPVKLFARIVKFIFGFGTILTGLFIVALHLVYLFGPFIFMYIDIVLETTRWKEWDKSTPCPHLWKDGLEDELWWF